MKSLGECFVQKQSCVCKARTVPLIAYQTAPNTGLTVKLVAFKLASLTLQVSTEVLEGLIPAAEKE